MQAIITYEEAKERGLKKYFTGEPCKYGHISERYVSGGCVSCVHDRSARRYVEHKEEIKEQQRQYYAEHREQKLEEHRIYRLKNPEKIKARGVKYRKNNPDKVKMWNKSYPETHKKAKKKWNSKNKEKLCTYSHNRRSRQRESQNNHTAQDVIELYAMQKGRCSYCKTNLKGKYHVDHIIPLSKGGDNSKHNIQICCPTCNLKKHAKDPIDFAQELGLLI